MYSHRELILVVDVSGWGNVTPVRFEYWLALPGLYLDYSNLICSDIPRITCSYSIFDCLLLLFPSCLPSFLPSFFTSFLPSSPSSFLGSLTLTPTHVCTSHNIWWGPENFDKYISLSVCFGFSRPLLFFLAGSLTLTPAHVFMSHNIWRGPENIYIYQFKCAFRIFPLIFHFFLAVSFYGKL